MTAEPNVLSAFEQGNQAGKSTSDTVTENPFVEGSAEHNNFEVGRRFGAAHTRPTVQALIEDFDEEQT